MQIFICDRCRKRIVENDWHTLKLLECNFTDKIIEHYEICGKCKRELYDFIYKYPKEIINYEEER